MEKSHAGRDILGRETFHRSRELPLDRCEFLVGHEPHAHLGGRLGGNDRLGAVACKAAQNAMDLEGRERPEPLEHGGFLQADESLALHPFVEKVLLVERQLLPGRELRFGRPLYGPVEAGDVDLAVRAFQATQQPAQFLVSVRRGTAVLARVQIGLRRPHGDLGVAKAAQRRVDRRPAGRDVRHVGYQNRVRAHALRLALQQIEQHLGPVLLFALDEKAKVHRRPRRRGDRLEQAEDLPLVVGRTARVDPFVALRRLERRRRPLRERIGRLHVVMSVNQQRRRARHVGAFAPNDRMGLAAEEFDAPTSDAPQRCRHPFGGGAAILIVCGQRRDRGDSQKLAQVVEQLVSIHGGTNVGRSLAASQRVRSG